MKTRILAAAARGTAAIDCPDELKGVPGTTLQCRLTTGSDIYPIDVTVTSGQGNDVNHR